VIARFEAERQALAMMDHPNIARLLDVGTTGSGRPYVVMELVKGVPITEYCDSNRLNVKQRLELFTSVCNAVQHAHQKGIIHRDLKPNNILVTEYDDKVVPKIIDFGLAKALHQSLTDVTMFTQFGQVVGTLAYMSPEQSRMNQLDVDTRTDIYSLGVLLYSLLTGTTPFDQKRLQTAALDELLRIIQQEEPPRPSTRIGSSQQLHTIAAHRKCEPQRLGAIIRGDLDWIVMRALEKDRSRRYQTANGLAADIVRYLSGEPTVAAPPTVGYRTRKLVNRHRLAFGVGALVLLLMMIGIVGTSTGMVWAISEKKRASESATQANLAADAAQKSKEEAVRNAQQAESARNDAEYAKYNANLQALGSMLDRQSGVMTAMLLRTAPSSYRNWEWAYQAFRVWPDQSVNESRMTGVSSRETLDTAAYWRQPYLQVAQNFSAPEVPGGMFDGEFSNDGNYVFLSRYDGGIHMYSTRSGKLVKKLPRAHGGILGIGLSPDGSRLASFVFSGGMFIWDIGSSQILKHHPFDLELISSWNCVWSRDAKHVISTHMGGNLRIWDSETLEELKSSPLTGHLGDVHVLFVHPKRNEVWSASMDGTIRQWSIPDGTLLGTKTCPVEQDIQFHCIDQQGKHAVSVGHNGESIVWDIENEKEVARLDTPLNPHHVGDVRHAASFSPDGSCVVILSGQSGAGIFEVESGQLIAELPRQNSEMAVVRFGPNGKSILTVAEDGKSRLWICSNTPANHLAQAHADVIYQVDMNEDGSRLLTGSYDTTATIWNMQTWENLATYRGHKAQVLAVDLSPDGSRAATLDATGALHLWDPDTGLPTGKIDPKSDQFAGYIRRAGGGIRANMLHFPAVLSTGLFTPDGTRVVAFEGESMKVFDAKSPSTNPVVLQDATKSGWPIFSFDSTQVAVLEMSSRTMRVWDLKTGQLLHTLEHGKGLVMANFSPCDHRLVTSSMDLAMRIWDTKTGKELHVMDDDSAHPSSCRFSKDGKILVAGYTDAIIRLWDSASGKLLMRIPGHNNRLRDARLNPDGTRLLSWSVDDQAIVWDAVGTHGSPLVLFTGDSRLVQARWTPDGRDLLTFWSDGSIEIHRGATKADLETFRTAETFTEAQLAEFRKQLRQAKRSL
jgi:WD40 repeat protein